MHKRKQKALIENTEIGAGCVLNGGADLQSGSKILGSTVAEAAAVTPNTAGGVALTEQVKPPKEAVLTLTDAEIEVAAADDFGNLLLLTLPNTNIRVLGVVVDLAVALDGFASDVATTLDMAVGTVLTASTDFSNAGEDNLCQKIDGVGAGTPGTVKGASDSTIADVELTAAADNKIYLNAACPVTADTGTLTLNGTVKVLYEDRGVAAA